MFHHITDTIKQMGLVDGIFYYIHRILSIISSNKIRLIRYHIVCQPVLAEKKLPPQRGRNIEIINVNREKYQAYYKDIFPRPESAIISRYNQGGICLVARKQEQFLGYIWLNLGPYIEDEVRCQFIPLPADNSAWDYDIYITPKARLNFTFPRLWDEANMLMNKKHISQTYSRIASYNTDSLKSHARLGAIIVQSINFLCLGKTEIMFAPLWPFIRLSFSDKQITKIEVRY